MLKELATHELISWFKAIQSTAPFFVLDQMMELAASALPEAQLNTIQEAIAVELV
ncbi:MAG: hypothetical protein ACOYVG_13355 [Bacteroidota bacterium]